MPQERILVTGGAGFIGSRLVRRVLAEGADVVVVDNLHPQVHGDWPGQKTIDNARLVRLGISDRDLAAVISEFRPHVVYHLAAETGTGQSMETIARYCDVNVTGTAVLLEALLDRGSALNKIVLASSRAVYGEGRYLTSNGEVVVPGQRSIEQLRAGRYEIEESLHGAPIHPVATTEDTPPAPVSVYASTKLAQEHLVSQVCSANGIPYSILRFQNVYGDGQSLKNPYTGVLSVFVTTLLRGQDINVFEDGEITRDFVYVDDAVSALMAAGKSVRADGIPINIGTGVRSRIVDVARDIVRMVGVGEANLKISGDFRAGDIRFALADIRRAKGLLGWSPSVSLGEGLERLIRWARGQEATGAAPPAERTQHQGSRGE